jgi:DNA-directed RNA polymerase specialized sigma24 family protein
MNASPDVSEDDLLSALRHEPARALTLLHVRFSSHLGRYLRSVTWGLLSVEDLQDVYQETLHGFWIQVQRPEFQPERYLGLLHTIARRKGLDALRRRGHRPRTHGPDVLLKLEADLHSSQLGRAWREKMTSAERSEFRRVLQGIVETLPHRQRLAARVFLDNFEDFGPRDLYEPLAAALAVVTGQPETALGVRSLWRTARATIAAELARRGYALNEDKP